MTAQDAMGHGGHHGSMSMANMARDIRSRFLVAALLSIPILLVADRPRGARLRYCGPGLFPGIRTLAREPPGPRPVS